MKPSMCLPLVVISSALALSSLSVAHASVLLQEDFSYTPGTVLTGQNGGQGFSGGWNTAPSISTEVTGVTYDYQVNGGGIIQGGSAGALLTSAPGSQIGAAVQRSLAEAHSPDEVFVSFLIRQTGGNVVNNDRFNVWLGNGTTPYGPYGGLLKTSVSTFYVRPNSMTQAASSLTPTFTTNSTYLIVLRFSKSEAGEENVYDQGSIWVNPSADGLGTPLATTAILSADASISSFSTIGVELRGGHSTVPNTYYFDQLTVGTSWNSVVPQGIPEPSTLLIGAAGGAMLLFWNRRRARHTAAR